jgi:trk system potassium uptake protein TrkA
MVAGSKQVELSTVLKYEARLFTFTASEADAEEVSALNLPEDARVICLYREEKFALAEPKTKLQEGDEVVVLTHEKNLEKLEERWKPKPPAPAAAS